MSNDHGLPVLANPSIANESSDTLAGEPADDLVFSVAGILRVRQFSDSKGRFEWPMRY